VKDYKQAVEAANIALKTGVSEFGNQDAGMVDVPLLANGGRAIAGPCLPRTA
jgi:hypothetical protein